VTGPRQGGRAQARRAGILDREVLDRRVAVRALPVWRDDAFHFVFEPIEFLEKLAAIIPRPAVNVLLHHWVLAPRARWRSQVVRYGRPAPPHPRPPP